MDSDLAVSAGTGNDVSAAWRVTMHLQASAVQRPFDIPVDRLLAASLLAGTLRNMGFEDLEVVPPDPGGVARAHDLGARLDDVPVCTAFRDRTAPDRGWRLEIVGEVEGRTALLVDD